MKKTLIVGAVILALLMFLNPSEKQHKDALRAAFIKAHPFLSIVGGANLVDAVVYHNYIIFSETEFNGQEQSFGICGNVTVNSGGN
jgi:hypothetical protein